MRQIGETSSQIIAAPQGAVFVWCNEHVDYAKDLCRHLNRLDLKVMSSRTALNDGLTGINGPVIVDHAFWQVRSAGENYKIERLTKRANDRGVYASR